MEDKDKIRVFSEEKAFITDAAINHHNSRYLPDVPVSKEYEQMRLIMCAKAPEKTEFLLFFDSKSISAPNFHCHRRTTLLRFLPELLRVHMVWGLTATYHGATYMLRARTNRPYHQVLYAAGDGKLLGRLTSGRHARQI